MERDRFLTEALGGKYSFFCVVDGDCDKCDNCVMQSDNEYTIADCMYASGDKSPTDCEYWKEYLVDGVSDFSTWPGFGKLWEWAQDQEWWQEFVEYMDINLTDFVIGELEVFPWIINPDRFANAVYEFLKK